MLVLPVKKKISDLVTETNIGPRQDEDKDEQELEINPDSPV